MTVILFSLPLLLTFVALAGADSLWNWLIGGGAALLLTLLGRRWDKPPPAIGARRIAMLPWLLWGILRGIAVGSWMMTQVMIGRRSWRHVGFITVEDAAETEEGLAILAFAQSAMPGSVVAAVDRESRSLVINVMDCSDARAEHEAVVRFYRRFQRPSVP